MTSYKVMCSDDGGQTYAENSLRFLTEAEAHQYALDLGSRWMGLTDWYTASSSDLANRTIVNGVMREL